MSTVKGRPDDPGASAGDRERIRRCYALAREAIDAGDHPFGALLWHDGEVVAEARNRVETDGDVTRHAELSLVSDVWGRIAPARLAAATLYSSTEPCLMCIGAIHWSGVRRVVYGNGARQLAELIGRPYRGIPMDDALRRMGSAIEALGPVLEAEGLDIHASFWPARAGSGSDLPEAT